MALSEEEALRIAARVDKALLKLEREQVKSLLDELLKAQNQIVAKMVAGGDEALPADVQRLQSLFSEIDRAIADLTRGWSAPMISLPERATALADTFAAEMLQTKLTVSFATVNRQALVTLQQYNLGLIKKATDELKTEIKSQLMQGIIQGESIPKVAKRLTDGTALDKGTFPRVRQRATVIARTETLRAFNQGALAQYQGFGVKRLKWLTGQDDRVCQYCGPLHEKIFPIDKLPLGGPPIHPQCRCVVTPHLAATAAEGAQFDKEAAMNAAQEQKRLTERPAKKRKAVS